MGAKLQNSREDEPGVAAPGEARGGAAEAAASITGPGADATGALMEEVLTRENLIRALKRVMGRNLAQHPQ